MRFERLTGRAAHGAADAGLALALDALEHHVLRSFFTGASGGALLRAEMSVPPNLRRWARQDDVNFGEFSVRCRRHHRSSAMAEHSSGVYVVNLAVVGHHGIYLHAQAFPGPLSVPRSRSTSPAQVRPETVHTASISTPCPSMRSGSRLGSRGVVHVPAGRRCATRASPSAQEHTSQPAARRHENGNSSEHLPWQEPL